jgi:hypothetical protein
MSRIGWSVLCGLVLLCVTTIHADGPLSTASASEKPRLFYLPAPNDVEARIVTVLSERTEVSFSETPLSDALDFLRDFHQINILLDQTALQDEGIDPGTLISLQVSGVTLRSALKLMLEPYALAVMVDSEVLKVTTRTRAREKVITRIYPVSDLADQSDDLEALQDAIRAATDGPWNEKGQPGAMSLVPRSKSIVVRHNAAVHDDIVELLSNLRAAQALAEPSATPVRPTP